MKPVIDHLNELRRAEMAILLARQGRFFRNADVLEIGAGTGVQLTALANVARNVAGVDLPSSSYKTFREATVIDYDGVHLPFPDASFDVIYSSNVMEHVSDPPALHADMRRVLRVGGCAIHVVPTDFWRLLTIGTYHASRLPRLVARTNVRSHGGNHGALDRRRSLIDYLIPPRHGEYGNRITEAWHYRKPAWRRRFEQLGWAVDSIEPGELLYSGNSVLGSRLSLSIRGSMASLLGSSCWIALMRPAPASTGFSVPGASHKAQIPIPG